MHLNKIISISLSVGVSVFLLLTSTLLKGKYFYPISISILSILLFVMKDDYEEILTTIGSTVYNGEDFIFPSFKFTNEQFYLTSYSILFFIILIFRNNLHNFFLFLGSFIYKEKNTPISFYDDYCIIRSTFFKGRDYPTIVPVHKIKGSHNISVTFDDKSTNFISFYSKTDCDEYKVKKGWTYIIGLPITCKSLNLSSCKIVATNINTLESGSYEFQDDQLIKI